MNELVDLVNQQGEVVERGIERKLVDADRVSYAAQNLFMRISVVVIFDDMGSILWHRRHPSKKFEGNMIDHVCGALHAGETPEEAAARESKEEVGVTPINLQEVGRRINEYGFYCVLFMGTSNEQPQIDVEREEVYEAGYATVEELYQMQSSGDLFVKDFFPDLELVLAAR